MNEKISYRASRHQPRNLYRHVGDDPEGAYIGVCFDPADTALVVEALNRVADVRAICDEAAKNTNACSCHGDACFAENWCCYEAKVVEVQRILAVLDGEDHQRDPLRDVVDVKWRVPGFDDKETTDAGHA